MVQSGEEVVQLEWSNLDFETALKLSNELKQKGVKGVRYRREDSSYPTWPLHFDAEREEEEAQRASEIAESCRDKEAADRIGGHPWSNC